MTAARDYEDMHQLIDRLTPDQLGEVRAHALRLAAGRRTFVHWTEVHRAAARLPHVDYERFRTDVDAVIDQNHLLGDAR